MSTFVVAHSVAYAATEEVEEAPYETETTQSAQEPSKKEPSSARLGKLKAGAKCLLFSKDLGGTVKEKDVTDAWRADSDLESSEIDAVLKITNSLRSYLVQDNGRERGPTSHP